MRSTSVVIALGVGLLCGSCANTARMSDEYDFRYLRPISAAGTDQERRHLVDRALLGLDSLSQECETFDDWSRFIVSDLHDRLAERVGARGTYLLPPSSETVRLAMPIVRHWEGELRAWERSFSEAERNLSLAASLRLADAYLKLAHQLLILSADANQIRQHFDRSDHHLNRAEALLQKGSLTWRERLRDWFVDDLDALALELREERMFPISIYLLAHSQGNEAAEQQIQVRLKQRPNSEGARQAQRVMARLYLIQKEYGKAAAKAVKVTEQDVWDSVGAVAELIGESVWWLVRHADSLVAPPSKPPQKGAGTVGQEGPVGKKLSGVSFQWEDVRGQSLVLLVFRGWDPARDRAKEVRQGLANLQAHWSRYASRPDVRFMGMCICDPGQAPEQRRALERLAFEELVTFDLVLATDAEGLPWGGSSSGLPVILLVSPEGRVRLSLPGDSPPAALAAALRQHLDQTSARADSSAALAGKP